MHTAGGQAKGPAANDTAPEEEAEDRVATFNEAWERVSANVQVSPSARNERSLVSAWLREFTLKLPVVYFRFASCLLDHAISPSLREPFQQSGLRHSKARCALDAIVFE